MNLPIYEIDRRINSLANKEMRKFLKECYFHVDPFGMKISVVDYNNEPLFTSCKGRKTQSLFDACVDSINAVDDEAPEVVKELIIKNLEKLIIKLKAI